MDEHGQALIQEDLYDVMLIPDLFLLLVSSGLWVTVLYSDSRFRRVAIPVLLALLIVSLIGRPWPWWIVTFALILLPRQWIISLALIGLGIGLLLNDLALGVAITLGLWAWSMRWWAGADAIVLVALTLRAGWAGLVAGLVAMLVVAVALFLKRRQPQAALLLAFNEATHMQPRATATIPVESGLPAAAVLAVVGIGLNLVQLIEVLSGRPA